MESNHMITFLEVEEGDREEIVKQFPAAEIYSTKLSEVEIIEKCQATEVLSVFIYTKITKKIIDNLPNLKLIVTRSVGYDHIDLKAADEKNIMICNVPDYGSHVIAEHVFALLLSGLRLISEGNDRVEKEKSFTFTGLKGIALKGKTLGIIGTGKIGKNVARIASLGFLMNVLAYDPMPDEDSASENHFKYTDLDTLLKNSDIISLHCPLLESTKHIINQDNIDKMKDGATIINTSRGGLISTACLISAIKSGKIAHAFLDVLEHEKNINEDEDLVKLPGVIVTPHIAFYADDSMKKMYSESFRSIREYIDNNKLLHQVKGE